MRKKLTKIDMMGTKLEVLREVYEKLSDARRSITTDFRIVGARPKRKIGEDGKLSDVIDEATGKVVMENIWDFVKKDDLSEEEEIKADTLETIMLFVESLVSDN